MDNNIINNTPYYQEYNNDFVIIPGEYSPPNSHYAHICIDKYINELNLTQEQYNKLNKFKDYIISFTIGSNGKVFKAITKQSKVKYIWYKKEEHLVEIWGDELYISDAMLRVKNRIKLVIENILNGVYKINLNKNKKNELNNSKMDCSYE
jgi:hypothetical protein